MKSVITDIREYLLLVATQLGLLMGSYYLLYQLGEFKVLPQTDNLFQFDANYYGWISRHGYQPRLDGSSPTAFFPLFPLLIRWLNLSPAGIVLLNATLFLSGTWLLVKNFSFTRGQLLTYLVLPSTLFFLLPYTEATFYFSCTLLITGLRNQRNLLIYSGLFLAALTRPSVLFFLPALVMIGLLHWQQTGSIRDLLLLSLGGGTTVVLGLLIVNFIQYADTQTYFAFWHTQSEQWNNQLQLPEFPLRTWGGSRRMWLDGMAFSCSVAALIFCVKTGWDWLPDWRKKANIGRDNLPTLPTTFAAAYLAIIGLFTLLYHGKDPLGGTTLMGINRYFFATAFFLILWRKVVILEPHPFLLDKNNGWYLGVFTLIMLLLLGAFSPGNLPNHLRTTAYFLFILAFLKWQYLRGMVIAFYGLHFALQLILLHGWLQGRWLG